jgi:hypothetical protein
MNRRIVRAFFAAATAGAIVALLAVMGASSAGAADKPIHHSIPVVYSQSTAGYFTSGMRFRFVAATLKVPAPQAVEGNNGPAALSLFSSKHAATLLVKAGGGAGSIVYDNGFGSGPVSLTPHVGNILQVSIYRDRATGRDEFVVTNTSTGRTRTVSVATPAWVVYRHASITGSVDNTKTVAPVAAIRLWAFKAVRMTSYNGMRGTVFGPWITSRFIDTTDGTASGNVVLYASNPWHNSQNFGIWMPEFPH